MLSFSFFFSFFFNRGDTIQYYGGLRSRELGQAPMLLVYIGVIISPTPLFSMILCSAEISFSQVATGDRTHNKANCITLNRRRPHKLRHKGGAKQVLGTRHDEKSIVQVKSHSELRAALSYLGAEFRIEKTAKCAAMVFGFSVHFQRKPILGILIPLVLLLTLLLCAFYIVKSFGLKGQLGAPHQWLCTQHHLSEIAHFKNGDLHAFA